MDAKTLFFSWDGRMGRKPFWIGIVSLELAGFAIGFVIGLVSPAMIPYSGLFGLLIVYPRICVLTKRLHDLNHSGWWQLLANLTAGLLSFGGKSVARSPGMETLGAAFVLLGAAASFGFYIWLGSMKGTPTTNDFGPAPGASKLVEVF